MRNTPFVTHIGQFRFEGNKGLRMVSLAHSSRKDFELLITCYIVQEISTTVSCRMNVLISRYWKLNVLCSISGMNSENPVWLWNQYQTWDPTFVDKSSISLSWTEWLKTKGSGDAICSAPKLAFGNNRSLKLSKVTCLAYYDFQVSLLLMDCAPLQS